MVNKVIAALRLSDADRARALEAAAIDRLVPAIHALEQDIRGAGALERLCLALPHLSERQLDALAALIDAMAVSSEEENVMT